VGDEGGAVRGADGDGEDDRLADGDSVGAGVGVGVVPGSVGVGAPVVGEVTAAVPAKSGLAVPEPQPLTAPAARTVIVASVPHPPSILGSVRMTPV
jgi:hypothetical protein